MPKSLALIIEDDEDLTEVFANTLQTVGFEVQTIQNGHDALNELGRVVPDMVLLDLHLPDVSGEEILRYIRAEKRLSKTRVMLATADPLFAEKLRSMADLVLLKPISVSQLRDLASRFRPN